MRTALSMNRVTWIGHSISLTSCTYVVHCVASGTELWLSPFRWWTHREGKVTDASDAVIRYSLDAVR